MQLPRFWETPSKHSCGWLATFTELCHRSVKERQSSDSVGTREQRMPSRAHFQKSRAHSATLSWGHVEVATIAVAIEGSFMSSKVPPLPALRVQWRRGTHWQWLFCSRTSSWHRRCVPACLAPWTSAGLPGNPPRGGSQRDVSPCGCSLRTGPRRCCDESDPAN